MPTEYDYVRASVAGGWDIDNPARLDTGEQIHLAKEIETALPGKTFMVRCDDTSCKVIQDVVLSGGDETTQDGVVSDHKNNV